MSIALLPTVLNAISDLETDFGKEFVGNHSDHDEEGVKNKDAIHQAMNRAGEEVRLKLSSLGGVSNELLKHYERRLAGFYLAQTRGKPPPDGTAEDVDWILKHSTKEGREEFALAAEGPWEVSS